MAQLKHIIQITCRKIDQSPHCRYATISTLSSCIAGLSTYFLAFSQTELLFFIFTSLVSAFFSYGNTLKQQSASIILGILITLSLCMITALTSPSITLSLIALIIISGVGYFYTLINMNAFFIVKFSIVIMAFAIDRSLAPNPISLHAIAITIALGGVCTLISNTCYQRLISRYKRPYLNHWESTLISIISTTDVYLSKSLINRLNSIITNNKNEHLKLSIDHQNIIERINITLTKYRALVIETTLTTPQTKALIVFFSALTKGIIQQSESIIQLAKENYIKQTITTINPNDRDIAEMMYLMGKLANNLVRHLNIDKTLVTSSTQTSLLTQLITQLKKQVWRNKDRTLSANSKVAIRAMVALPIAYVVAILLPTAHPAWLLLSTNLVLQVRYGDTLKKASDRILGHTIGFLLAIPLFLLVWPYFSTPLFWVPVIVFITAYHLMKNYTIFSTTLMIGIIYLYALAVTGSHINQQLFHISFDRWVDITLGSIIALAASLCIFIDAGAKQVAIAHRNMLKQVDRALNDIIQKNPPKKLIAMKQALAKTMENNQALYRSILYQPEYHLRHKLYHLELTRFEHSITRQTSSLIYRLTTEQINTPLSHTLMPEAINNIQVLRHIIHETHTHKFIKQREAHQTLSDQIFSFRLKLQEESNALLQQMIDNTKECETMLHFIGINHIIRDMAMTVSDAAMTKS